MDALVKEVSYLNDVNMYCHDVELENVVEPLELTILSVGNVEEMGRNC